MQFCQNGKKSTIELKVSFLKGTIEVENIQKDKKKSFFYLLLFPLTFYSKKLGVVYWIFEISHKHCININSKYIFIYFTNILLLFGLII